MKYGKLLTKDGHIISSKWISKDKMKSKNNYSVVVSILPLVPSSKTKSITKTTSIKSTTSKAAPMVPRVVIPSIPTPEITSTEG